MSDRQIPRLLGFRQFDSDGIEPILAPAAVPDPADVEKAAPHDLREPLARWLGGELRAKPWEQWSEEARNIRRCRADALLAGPLAPLLDRLRRAEAAARPSPDSEAVARVEALARVLVDAPGQGPLAAALIFGALAGGDAAKLAEYERAVLGTGDREGE